MVNKNPKPKSPLEIIRGYHGSASVFGGDEDVNFNVKATSTGSLNLDEAIGCSGIPDGRLILWSGPESSGKTLGSLCFAKKKQAEGKRVLFIDAEFTWDRNWVQKLGVRIDSSHMLVMQESSGVKIFDTLCGKPATKTRKNAIPGILSEEILNSMKEEGAPLGAIIVDSINTVVPPMEEDMETGATQIGSLSRFLPPVLRRLTPLLSEFQIPCIFICQARTNIGQMHGDPLTVSGGKALMHGASLWIDSRKIGGSEIYRPDDNEKAEPIGHQVRCKIRKNKVGPPSRKAELTIYYEKGVDLRPELLDQGLLRGLIRREGNTLLYSGFPGGKLVGSNNAMGAIFQDKTLQQKLLSDILDHRANQVREAKKNSSEFVETEEEDVVAAEGPVKTKTREETGTAKVVSGEEAEPQRIVMQGGKRIDADTGEILSAPEEVLSDDEFQSVKYEEPKEDPEQVVQTVDESGKVPAITPAPTESLKIKEEDIKQENINLVSLSQLKEIMKKRGLPKWWKVTREEAIKALFPNITP